MRVWDLEALAEDVAGLVLHKQETAVRLIACDLLHHVQVVDGGEEIAKGEDRDWLFGGRRCWVAEFVDLRAGVAIEYIGD